MTALDNPDTSDSLIPRLDFKHSQAAVVRTNEDLVSLLQEQQSQGQNFKKEEVNGSTKGLLSSPDPILAETTRLLNNLREDYYEYQCTNCQYKEKVWKNNTKPKFCVRCKTLSTEE